MSMGESMGARTDSVTRTARTLRAHDRSRWAERRNRSDVLAVPYKVSASRVRHFSSDDLTGPLTTILAAIEDPAIDGEAIAAVLMEAVEARYVEADPETLRKRLNYLRLEQEHVAESRQNRALQGEKIDRDAIRAHIATLTEILNIDARLS